jgi:hypothetical protein
LRVDTIETEPYFRKLSNINYLIEFLIINLPKPEQELHPLVPHVVLSTINLIKFTNLSMILLYRLINGLNDIKKCNR